MLLNKAALMRQYANDPELRSCVNCFVFSAIASFVGAFFPIPVVTSIAGLLLLFTYIGSPMYGFKNGFTMQATGIGLAFGTCLSYALQFPHPWNVFFRYATIMATFHFSEFFFTAVSNRRSLQQDSFLLNHSYAYWIAAVTSWTEFCVEAYFLPSMKSNWISIFGIICCITGEVIRKTAMIHAGTGFTHRLALSKRPDHRLVTTGVYAYFRHPGYTGWFLWSVGTQLTLCNPLCTLAYAYVSWNFFNDRIYDEERDLLQFFGDQYVEYQKNVWSGLPFIPGYPAS